MGFYFSISLGATLYQTTEGMKIKQPSIVTVGNFDVTGLIQLIFRNGCRWSTWALLTSLLDSVVLAIQHGDIYVSQRVICCAFASKPPIFLWWQDPSRVAGLTPLVLLLKTPFSRAYTVAWNQVLFHSSLAEVPLLFAVRSQNKSNIPRVFKNTIW